MRRLLLYATFLFALSLQAQETPKPDFIFVGATNIAPATHSLSSVTGIAAYAKYITSAGNHPVLSYTSATYSSLGFIIQEGILIKTFSIKDLSVYSGFDAGIQNANTTSKTALSYGGLIAYPINKTKTMQFVMAGRNLFVGTVGGPIITFGVAFHLGK